MEIKIRRKPKSNAEKSHPKRPSIVIIFFLAIIFALAGINLIKAVSSDLGIKPFGFLDEVIAGGGDVIVPGDLPNTPCSPGEVDVLRYMMPLESQGFDMEFCPAFEGITSQGHRVERTGVGETGKEEFLLHKGGDHERYAYDNDYVYFIEDTSWNGICEDTGERAWYKVYDAESGQLGGKIPRCISDGGNFESPQKIQRLRRDEEGNPIQEVCKNDDPATTVASTVSKVGVPTQYGPQVQGLDVIDMVNTGGAGSGEHKFYCAGYGLCGFYDGSFHSSIMLNGVNPSLQCDGSGGVSPTSISSLALQEKYNIRDNTDRCIPINPANGSPMSSSTSMYVGKGGLNQGNLVAVGGDDIPFIQGQSDKNKTNLDMGYILRIALGPEDVGSTGNFIKEANNSGLVPVVRLCYSPEAGANCNFDLNVPTDHPNSIAKFYRDIYNNLGDSFEAVFVTGPNEPGTASEMTGFKIANGDYATLVARTNDVARAIQDIRGGGVYLTPAIFNTSTNLSGRYPTGGDFEAYNANGIDWSLFDYILANMYDTKSNNSFEEYKRTGVQSFAAQHGLKVIISEFGLFDKDTPGVKDQFMTNFSNFCAENNVDGILFFRSIEELGQIAGPNADTLPVADIAAMTKSCVRLRPWLNCNFDSAIYPDQPDKISMVSDSLAGSNPSCIVREPTTSKGAALLVACGGDSCSAKMVKTIRADLPVKHFGSNSSFGTKTKQFSPISAEIAALTDIADYDAMNQFAGELEGTDGSRYAMPLLGSAINSTTELSLYLGDFARYPYLQSFPSPGSFSSNIKDEIRTEIDRNIGGAISNPKSIYVEENGVRFIPDERVVNVDGNNMDKTDVNALKDIRDYNPYAATNFSKPPNSCSGDMKYLNNPDDYIPGPEVLVEEKTLWSGSGGELCRRYGERNNGATKDIEMQTGSTLNCSVSIRQVPIAGGTALVNCRSVVFCNFGAGNCTINPAYSSCMDYVQAPTDKVYMYANDFASIPQYKIKDVWDALSRQYQILQDSLKTRGLKMVFQENIGWRAQYQSAIRDANKGANAGTNLYSSSPEELEFSQNGISGSAFEPNLFDNNYLFAKGKSIVRTEQYYDWLGYLDIIQEMRMIYLNSTPLGAEERIENPYFQREGPNSERPEINLSGLASQVSSFPFITCDQVELCKNKDKVISDLGQEEADKLCPFEAINSSAKLTCVTDIDDDRFTDNLGTQLCQRGYTTDLECNRLQCIPDSDGNPVIIDENLRFQFPSSQKTIISSYGCISRDIDNGNCHTGVDFAIGTGSQVFAAAEGKVIYSGIDPEYNGSNTYNGGYPPYGLMIKIQHVGGITTLYAHLSELLVQEGAEVSAGAVIALSGNTGNSTGPHLHFELRRNGTCQWDGTPSLIGRCTADPTPHFADAPSTNPGIYPGCFPNPDEGGEAIPGILKCNVDLKNTGSEVDWVKATPFLSYLINAYNQDANNSYFWIGSSEMTSDPEPSGRAQRIQVTDFVVSKSIQMGLNPKFVINLWIEETAGSAVGSHALGCGISSLPQIPINQGPDAMIEHMRQQIDCLAGVVNKTTNFAEFMCTYSGEPAIDSTLNSCDTSRIEDFGTIQPNGVRMCNRFLCNPNFPINICKYYNEL